MKKSIIKPALPLLLTLALVISVCGSTGSSLGRYIFSKDVATLSLVVKPEVTPEAVPEERGFDINTDNVLNISVSRAEHAAVGVEEAEQYYALQLAADEGYLLPETIGLGIGENNYEISTVLPEVNPEGFSWIPEEGILLIPCAVCPEEGFTLVISAVAVPEAIENEPAEEEEKQGISLVLNLSNMAPQAEKEPAVAEDYKLSFVPDEGYRLPDSISVDIDGLVFNVLTDGIQQEPTAPAFDPETGALTIPAVLLTEATQTITITAAAVPVEESPDAVAEPVGDDSADGGIDGEVPPGDSGDGEVPAGEDTGGEVPAGDDTGGAVPTSNDTGGEIPEDK